MNDAHLHLIVNHFPIIGTVISILALVAGLLSRNKGVIKTALGITLFSGLMAIPAMMTGDKAEHMMEDLLPEARSYIHEHEEQAETAIWVALAMGAFALMALIADKYSSTFAQVFTILALLTALGNAWLMKNVGTSGGEIRHTEIREDGQPLPETEHH